jgi:CBS domain-containing protein
VSARHLTVAEAMVVGPAVHPPTATAGELRAFFEDEHVHMALLVEDGTLVGAVERADLGAAVHDETLAGEIATLDGRTIAPDAGLAAALAQLRLAGRRRLAVTEGGSLLGLLYLKASGDGFCSDADVGHRGTERAAVTGG